MGFHYAFWYALKDSDTASRKVRKNPKDNNHNENYSTMCHIDKRLLQNMMRYHGILKISDLFCPMTDSWESYATLHRVRSVIVALLRLISSPEPKVYRWAYRIGGPTSFVVHTL